MVPEKEDMFKLERVWIIQTVKKPSGWGSNERGNVIIFGTVIEKNPNGPGSKMSSVRLVDMCGNIPGIAIKGGSEKSQLKEFENWTALIEQKLAGKI